MRARPFAQVDVFSAEPQGGNPVAVVLDAEGVGDDDMQRFATWTNLAETTFVLPPTAPGADYRVRIFTVSRELPFAGHPTLGTCHAWLAAHPDRAAGDRFVQECEAGLVEIRRTPAGLAFAAPPLVRSGPVEASLLAAVAADLGVAPEAIVDAQWADNGPGWLAVLLASADEVLALAPALTAHDDVGVAAIRDDGELEMRAFIRSEGGVDEDPVTGSLNASLAGWLLASGRLRAPYVARQGTALGRTGRVHISEADGEIWVAGATTTWIDGTVTL
ncbi:MAG: PhzF family phenazine biosynthesis protein [Solirubrobacteraceae bacterium]